MNLKKVGIGLLVALVLIIVVSFLLPSSWNVKESITINAKTKIIYPLISDLKAWQKWAVWNKEMDPTVQYRFEGPEQGVGAHQFWDGKKMGKGHLLITESDEESGIKYDLFFNDSDTPSKGAIQFVKTDKGTEVIWTDSGSLGANPLKRYMGLIMNNMIAKDFKKGLENLKTLSESLQVEADKMPPVELIPEDGNEKPVEIVPEEDF